MVKLKVVNTNIDTGDVSLEEDILDKKKSGNHLILRLDILSRRQTQSINGSCKTGENKVREYTTLPYEYYGDNVRWFITTVVDAGRLGFEVG